MILLNYAHKKKFKKISSKTITSILNKTTKNQYLQFKILRLRNEPVKKKKKKNNKRIKTY